MPSDTDIPIACTLTGASYQERLAWIQQLMRDGLRSHDRRDLVLELRYAPLVADRVRDLVRNEEACCGFLRFDVTETPDEICLTITAPERAREAADALFDQFLPAGTREGFSIPAQRKLLKGYAELQGFCVTAEFEDIETAKNLAARASAK